MKFWNKHFLIIPFLLVMLTMLNSTPCYAENLRGILKKAQTGGTYASPGQEELSQAEQLFTRILRGESVKTLQKDWERLHFELREFREENRDFLILSEKVSHKTGRGFYLFPRIHYEDKFLLQAPHSFKDLYTGDIGLKLALEGTFTAIAWNTVPRYFTENDQRVEADLSDLFDTYFAAITRAFARHYTGEYIIQLHGYARGKRTTRAGAESDIILSTGTKTPEAWLTAMDGCLEQKFSTIVGVYPLEVKELGATKTSIGIILRQMNEHNFLHVEMSKQMREMIRKNPDARKKMLECIRESLP